MSTLQVTFCFYENSSRRIWTKFNNHWWYISSCQNDFIERILRKGIEFKHIQDILIFNDKHSHKFSGEREKSELWPPDSLTMIKIISYWIKLEISYAKLLSVDNLLCYDLYEMNEYSYCLLVNNFKQIEPSDPSQTCKQTWTDLLNIIQVKLFPRFAKFLSN